MVLEKGEIGLRAFITCINGMKGTATDAQVMVSNIAHQLGFRSMGIYTYHSSKESWESLSSRYDGIIAGVQRGDLIFFQHPVWGTIEFEKGLVDRIKLYGGRVVIMVHDLIPLMYEKDKYLLKKTMELFNLAEVLVVPSYAMRRFLLENGIRENMKFVVQEIWDYTTSIQPKGISMRKEIHFAGSPSKFLFPQQWDFDVPLKVYTSETCTGKNTQVMGWMEPSALLLELSKGGFGLLWYGDEYWHQYMGYNCSFKLSTYLAAGIPVIVPRGISNEYLIEKNHLGLIVDTLDEAAEAVRNMEPSEYEEYVRHVREFSPLIRDGYFTKRLLIDAVHTLRRKDMAAAPEQSLL